MNHVFRWVFGDRRDGRIVIAQMPNAAMWIVLIALSLSFVVPQGRASTAIEVVLYLAVAVWSLDEAARGVNPWRRILGVGTFTALVVWILLRR